MMASKQTEHNLHDSGDVLKNMGGRFRVCVCVCVCGQLAVTDCFVQVFDFLSLSQAFSVGLASN